MVFSGGEVDVDQWFLTVEVLYKKRCHALWSFLALAELECRAKAPLH